MPSAESGFFHPVANHFRATTETGSNGLDRCPPCFIIFPGLHDEPKGPSSEICRVVHRHNSIGY
jgi:hypothetical protein